MYGDHKVLFDPTRFSSVISFLESIHEVRDNGHFFPPQDP